MDLQKSTLFVLLSFTFLWVSCQNIQLKSKNKVNGVSFVAARDSLKKEQVLPVKKIHANFVSLMPFAVLNNVASSEIRFHMNRQWFGETDPGLQQYAYEFRREGIKIMVKPQIWVWNGSFTGNISMETEEDWIKLQDSYTNFILFYAKSAQKMNAEIFCIGTELEKFVTARPIYWKDLIQQIKKIYKGKLTYAANWNEFTKVSFWGQLDFIGIDAYFPLSTAKTPTVRDLELGWQEPKNEILSIQKKNNKPILFTEFGYRSIDYTGKAPWETSRVEGAVNLQAQQNALQAIHNQFWQEEWFAGGFVWKWFLDYENVGGLDNNRFTLQHKPAEKLLERLYQK